MGEDVDEEDLAYHELRTMRGCINISRHHTRILQNPPRGWREGGCRGWRGGKGGPRGGGGRRRSVRARLPPEIKQRYFDILFDYI